MNLYNFIRTKKQTKNDVILMKISIIMHLTTVKYKKASFLAHSVNIGTIISFFYFSPFCCQFLEDRT